ncbi:LPXTG cell wall anchor domain-containing protein [Streptomyces sp. TRM66268-LWL]|uniref:LPXTG cell wall anchor domain-containing protein n=1 Tax=Streptomyces polyasparticus TaxID=2767826 RepID=A0ABR7SWT1_9ACTN|nr:SpaA isopeptide-forming pilin-related protein [Streptomyces polyasparticus]MBC9719244.1 LPXTG cell wall anchor domain-containing protein [Streptomyces polyasparticus]
MRIRSARTLPAAVAVAATVTGSLSWAPTASAQSTGPTPSASTSSTPRNATEPETGGVVILKKDPGGDVLAGAAFALFDSAGKEAANGKTDAQGKLAFKGLAPGVYRLKEVSSGSNLHDTVDDQDVIVTPGTDTPLTIVDPFKDASVLLKAKDDKTGKLLAGSTVNIGSGDKTLLTLTTGSDGTATGKLPVNSRTGTDFWVRQVKAPAGYDLYKPSKEFKAKPGDPVTVTTTNAKTATTPPPTEKPTDKPTEKPSDKPSPGNPGKDEDTPAPSDSATPTSDETASSTAAPAPEGSLAHTGADATPWLLGGAGLLIAAGGGALAVARRRRTGNDATDEN